MPPRPLLLFSLLLAALGLAACGSPREAIVERGLGDESAELLDLETLFPTETVFRWQISRDPESAAWIPATGSRLERRANQVVLTSASGVASAEREAGFQASAVDIVEVKLDGLRGGRVIVGWSGPEVTSEATAFLAEPVRHPYNRHFKTYRFAVASHPQWRGPIERLRLRVEGSSPTGYAVRYVLGAHRLVDEDRRRRTLERPWKLVLEGEARDGWLTPPGSPRRLELSPPAPGSRLRLAHGILGSRPRPTLMQVTRIDPGGEGQILFEGRRQDGPWQEVEIDLTPYAGQKLRLELSAQPLGAPSHEQGASVVESLAVWSAPEVLGPEGPATARAAARPNIVLICLDTLRADRMSLYGHPRETSPVLDRWAAGAAVFDHALAASPWTLPSHVSLFAGLDAHRHGVTYNNDRLGVVPTLAGELRAHGYRTEAITGGGFLRPEYGLARGFDRFRFWQSRRRQEDELAVHLDHALERLSALAGERFFLFFHTYEVHSPFTPRQPWFQTYSGRADSPGKLVTELQPTSAEEAFRTRYGFALETRGQEHRQAADTQRTDLESPTLDDATSKEGQPPTKRQPPTRRPLRPDEGHLPGDLYDSAIAYTDAQIGRLLAHLEALGLADDTVVVLTSDHGELLGEDGLASHAYLREENLRVPLVIALPGEDGHGRRIPYPVGSVDLMPTLLEIAGIPTPPDLDGTSLLPVLLGDDRPPRGAWSYAGSTNRGLQVDFGRRGVFAYDDTPWRLDANSSEAANAGEAADLDETASSSEAATSGESAALRELARQRLAENRRGLFLELHNPTGQAVTGHLEAQRFVPTSLKALDLPCPCVTWESAQRIAFEIPPESAYTLVFRRRLGSDHLTLDFGADQRFRFEIEDLATPRTLARTANRWQLTASAPPGLPRIHLWRENNTPADSANTHDAELQQQLRALGYID